MSLIPESGRSPGGGNGNRLQYSCLKHLLDQGAWRATVHGVAKSWMWWSHWACIHTKVDRVGPSGPSWRQGQILVTRLLGLCAQSWSHRDQFPDHSVSALNSPELHSMVHGISAMIRCLKFFSANPLFQIFGPISHMGAHTSFLPGCMLVGYFWLCKVVRQHVLATRGRRWEVCGLWRHKVMVWTCHQNLLARWPWMGLFVGPFIQ